VPFDPNAKSDQYMTIEGPASAQVVAPSRADLSPADRIAAARERAIQIQKESYDGTYGVEVGPGYFKDYAGDGTSEFEADILMMTLALLEVPKYMTGNWCNPGGHYDRRTGAWMFGSFGVPLQAIRAVVDDRVRELGLSDVLIAEYFGERHGVAEDQVFRRLSFADRIGKFRITGAAQ
jgi:hypothetical protein